MKLGHKMKALLLLCLLMMSMWPSLLAAQTDATAGDTTMSDTAANQAELS